MIAASGTPAYAPAAVSNILSALALVVSAGSLYVSYLAWRRAGSDRRLRLRQSARELGIQLDGTDATLALARQSRQAVLGMEGLALSGNAKLFEQGADADAAELIEMHGAATANVGAIDLAISDAEIEDKLVEVAGLKARAEQISAKYVAALAEDDQKRSEKRQAMHALGNQIRMQRTPGSGSGSSGSSVPE